MSVCVYVCVHVCVCRVLVTLTQSERVSKWFLMAMPFVTAMLSLTATHCY